MAMKDNDIQRAITRGIERAMGDMPTGPGMGSSAAPARPTLSRFGNTRAPWTPPAPTLDQTLAAAEREGRLDEVVHELGAPK